MDILDRDAIAAMIPHAGRMCLLEAVTAYDAQSISARATSHRAADNPLRSGDRLSIEAGIEYAAQAMAVHGGLVGGDGPPRRGFVAIINQVSWQAECLDELDSDLLIQAQALQSMADSRNYAFSLSCAGRTLLEGEAMVVLEALETN